MVDTVRRETLQPVRAPKAQPTLLTGQSGQIRLGTGTLNAPRIASPIRLQYIPQPTQLGRNIGAGIAQMSDQVGEYALRIADKEARTAAALDAQQSANEIGNMLIGSSEQPGVLLLNGEKYTKGFDGANQAIDKYIEEKAKSIDSDLHRSYYVASMASTTQTFKKELRNKHKIESIKAEKQGFEATDRKNISNAVMATNGPDVRQMLLIATGEKVARGEHVQLAYDEVIVNFTRALLGQPQGRQRYKTLNQDNLFDGISAAASAEIEKYLMADIALEAKFTKDSLTLEKHEARQFWNGNRDVVMKELANLSDDPAALHAKSQELQIQAEFMDPSGVVSGKVKSFSDILAKQYTGPDSERAVNLIGQAELTNTAPWDVAGTAKQQGIEVSSKALKDYTKWFYTAGKDYIKDEVGSWEKRMIAHVPTTKGLSAGFSYFMATPQGKSFLEKQASSLRRDSIEAYAKNGAEGVTQVIDKYTTLMQDPNSFGTAMQEVLFPNVSYTPSKMAPLETIQKYQGLSGNAIPDVIETEDLTALGLSVGLTEAQLDYVMTTYSNEPEVALVNIIMGTYERMINESAYNSLQKRTFKSELLGQKQLMLSIMNSGAEQGNERPKPDAEKPKDDSPGTIMDSVAAGIDKLKNFSFGKTNE